MAKQMYGFPLEKVLEEEIGVLAMIVAAVKAIDVQRQLTDEEQDFLKCTRRLYVQWRNRVYDGCASKKSDRVETFRDFDRIEEALCWVLVKRRGLDWNGSDDEDLETQDDGAPVGNSFKKDQSDGKCESAMKGNCYQKEDLSTVRPDESGPAKKENCCQQVNLSNVGHKKDGVRSKPVKFDLSCHLCNGPHILINCDRFRNMLSSARLLFVRKKLLCVNCYGVNHDVENCPSGGRCLRCNGKHHTKLHAGLQRGQ